MADFFSSHSENEDSEVEAIISQAKDLVVLEQISSINLSGVSDFVLPTDLESRFRKLKSFPETKTGPSRLNSQVEARVTTANPSDERADDHEFDESEFMIDLESRFRKLKSFPETKSGPSSLNSQVEARVTTANPSDEPADYHEFDESEFKSATEGNNKAGPDRSRNVSKLLSSSSISSASSFEASSPPRQSCCFWHSPRKLARIKRKENRVPKVGNDELKDWGKNEEFMTGLSLFSEKEQNRRLKKVLKEQEKIGREADKIVQWAKQASARMNTISGIEDGSKDDDKNLKH